VAREFFDIPAEAVVLLAFGGSLGARHINERLIAHAERLMAVEGLHVLHITGIRDYDDSEKALGRNGAGRWKL
ncbi:MAG TPA: UDP-N-acetylglucosamine--N-acetylmuramyl-(pentapeptide) pyrophosphoryl-undecaprenol N-acetylglucosamine transferase, partial [Coriobacteriia bacterium]|nr:UDP-N-acetylglucosamine--N-acetylmuramyl-(pentapeptide) pyrophosphoryl-undecaprenol N-acetylglucosamine transferase [Coriobacteriia bacterium]